jgi:hypothetical protein
VALIDYGHAYPKDFDDYNFVQFDCGSGLTEDQQVSFKAKIKQILAGEDCIGSINCYKDKLNGVLLMHSLNYQRMYDEFALKIDTLKIFDKITKLDDANYMVHDKWGRAESFILFH